MSPTQVLAATLMMLMLGPASAGAQARITRGDVSGTLGWFNAHTAEADIYDEWANRSLVGQFGGSVYWTRHWKTEVLAGASTEAEVYGATSIVVNGQSIYSPLHLRLSTRRLEITQQYQFGDNQWFHPYLGAGADVVWETRARRRDPVYFYDQVLRQSRLIVPEDDRPERRTTRAVPALAIGFKSYLTARAFFRSDLRVTFDRRPDEVIARFGFGVDF